MTDPPYFLDGLDADWKKGKRGKRGTGSVGGLPIGMKFDSEQGKRLQAFLEPVFEQLIRILKPGGFMLVFSAPRLYHRMAIAAEDCRFEIRDQYIWQFTQRAQFKAFGMTHFLKKRVDISDQERKRLTEEMDGRKTPQLRPQFESILCAQKPREGTFVDNWRRHRTGLIDSRQSLTGNVPSTVMSAEKPTKDRYNCHLTPKPLKICEHLIKVFSCEGQTILDPFLGSGTTCLAAQRTNRFGIGIEINPDYVAIAEKRLEIEPRKSTRAAYEEFSKTSEFYLEDRKWIHA
ncbi:DNA-methyltransferase [Thioalkalivibrio sp. HK1]|uniref:DNA-methyltransferase n=1 Tax=Thioalkalivibrio sp. HK1 TaxID=1469245 RepID=UPI0018CC4D72|nr:site-specific DNA-methyltransferase [Thioalkalivibrio sp. HK1]